MTNPGGRRSVTRIVLMYFFGAGAWILGSDLALLAAYPDSASTVIGSLVKGGLFVVFTSALLYFVLRTRPAAEAPAVAVERVGDTQRQGRWPALIPFMLLTAALVSACAWLFVREQHEHQEFAHQQLESRADIKARELGIWLKDQSQSAQSYGRARSFQEDLPGILRGDRGALVRVEKRLEEVRRTHEVDTILVLDPGGRTLAAAGNKRSMSADFARDVAAVAQTRKPRFHVLHRAGDANGAPVVLDQIVPVELDSATETAPAVFVLRDDAASTLFTMVRYWPVESRTGETYLVRRAGDRIEYLSELKAKPGAPLTPGASIASGERVSAQLIGGKGFAEKAVDYRGVAVLAASRAVPDTDWRVIAKMDLDEVLEPVRDQAQFFLFLIVGFTLFTAYGANRMWRQHMQLVALRERAENAERRRAENQLSAAEERYRALFDRSLDCIFLADLEGNFLDANRSALDLFGYRREEIPSISYRALLDPEDLQRAYAALQEVIRTGSQREVHEYALRRKDGSRVIVESKTALVYAGDEPSAILGIARDITGRKQAEEKIRRLNRVYAVLSGINTTIVRVKGRQELFNEACRIAVEQGNFAMAWIGALDETTLDVTPVAWAGESAEAVTRVKSSAREGIVAGQGAVGRSIRERRPIINNEIATRGFGGPRRQEILKLGFQSQITLPLYEKKAVAGVLTIYAREPNFFDEEELRLLTELAGDISFAVEILAGEQARQRAQQELEYKSTMLQTQQEASPDAILVVDTSARIISYNQQFLAMWDIGEEMARSGADMPVLQTVVGQMQNPEDFLNKIKYLYEHREEKSRDELYTKDGRIIDRHSAPVIGANGEYFGRVWYFRDITARKKSEEAIARLAAIVESSGDAIVSRGIDGKIQSWNAAAEHMFGWRADEAVGQPITIIIPPERRGELRPLIERVIAGETIGAIESLHLCKDGRRIDTSTTFSAIRDASGRVTAVSLIYRDITERQRNEQALAESEARFRQMADSIGEVFWMAPPDYSSITYVSPAFERIWGWTQAELYANPKLWLEAIHPEDAPHVISELGRLAQEGSYDIEYRITRRDGGLRWINDRGYASRDNTGRVNLTTGVATDITERKRSELESHESEQRFRAMIEQSISGFYMIQDDRFTYVNSRFAEIFGYAATDEIVGKHPTELVVANDRALVSRNIQRRLAGQIKSLSYSFTGVKKDGKEIEVGVHGSHATYQGHPVIMGLMQDISERKHAEEEIKRYVARLEQAMQSTINVVATIGELRDPYTHGHERRVGEIAAAIATEMGLESNQVEGIRNAGYMHDVGKIGVPAEILAKPGKLTKAEYDLVKDHVQQSYEILKTVPFPWPVADAAWQHHERMDGSGYPRGLKGEEIILEARILAVADTVEAMSSHRPYRPGLGLERALAEIEKNRGKLFWPQAVDACLRLVREKAYTLPA